MWLRLCLSYNIAVGAKEINSLNTNKFIKQTKYCDLARFEGEKQAAIYFRCHIDLKDDVYLFQNIQRMN